MDLKEREQAFEKKLEHDQTLQFKAEAKRNRMLADWVCELLGIAGAERDKYRAALQAADFEEAGDEDVFRKLRHDLDAGNAGISDHRIRKKMNECMQSALQEVRDE